MDLSITPQLTSTRALVQASFWRHHGVRSQEQADELARRASVTSHTVVRWLAGLPITKRSFAKLASARADMLTAGLLEDCT